MAKKGAYPPVTDQNIEDLLATSFLEAREIVEALRLLVRDTVPDAVEYYSRGWGAIAYRHPKAGYFVGIFPLKDNVTLLFEHGIDLPDPDGVLTGSGTQTRVIPIRAVDAIPENAIRVLLREALAWVRKPSR